MRNKMNFKDFKETRIGTIAEEFVDDYLISQGYQTWFNTNKQSTPCPKTNHR